MNTPLLVYNYKEAVAAVGYHNDFAAYTPVSYTHLLVEADRVCSPDGFDRLVPCTVQGYDVHCIVQGVETDADGHSIKLYLSKFSSTR